MRLIILTSIALLMTACASLEMSDDKAFTGPGASDAAAMGYHGPVRRVPDLPAN